MSQENSMCYGATSYSQTVKLSQEDEKNAHFNCRSTCAIDTNCKAYSFIRPDVISEPYRCSSFNGQYFKFKDPGCISGRKVSQQGEWHTYPYGLDVIGVEGPWISSISTSRNNRLYTFSYRFEMENSDYKKNGRVIVRDNSRSQRIFADDGDDPSISADGKRVAYRKCYGYPDYVTGCDIYVAELYNESVLDDDIHIERITRSSWKTNAYFSKYPYHSSSNLEDYCKQNPNLCPPDAVFDSNGHMSCPVEPTGPGLCPSCENCPYLVIHSHPSLNEDGTRVTFMREQRYSDGSRDWAIQTSMVELDNYTLPPLATLTDAAVAVNGRYPSITGDGRKVYFACDGGLEGICAANFNGSDLSVIIQGAEFGYPVVSGDGSVIAYNNQSQSPILYYDFFRADSNGDRIINLTDGPTVQASGMWPSIQYWPSINYDGTRIAFPCLVYGGSNEFNICIADPSGSAYVVARTNPNTEKTSVSISGDGRNIFFCNIQDEKIYIAVNRLPQVEPPQPQQLLSPWTLFMVPLLNHQ